MIVLVLLHLEYLPPNQWSGLIRFSNSFLSPFSLNQNQNASQMKHGLFVFHQNGRMNGSLFMMMIWAGKKRGPISSWRKCYNSFLAESSRSQKIVERLLETILCKQEIYSIKTFNTPAVRYRAHGWQEIPSTHWNNEKEDEYMPFHQLH